MQLKFSSPSDQAQREPGTYRLAANSMRGVRLQLEYQQVEEKLRAWGVQSTVVVFGGALIWPDGSPSIGSGTRAASPASFAQWIVRVTM